MTVHQKHEELIATAERVLEDGLDFWANDRPADGSNTHVAGRVQQYDQILMNRNEYTTLLDDPTSNFSNRISEPMKDQALRRMSGALLYLAAAGYKDNGEQSELIGDDFDQKPSEVAEFVLELNQFSKLEKYPASKIADRLIAGTDDRLYQLFTREVSATRTGIQDINVPGNVLSNDWETEFLNERLTERQDKMNEAIQEYVSKRKLYEILGELEEAIIETGEASETRAEIADTIKSEIDEFEEELRWLLKSQRELFASEVDEMTAELERTLLTTDEFHSELEEFEGELQWAFREHREYLLSELQAEAGQERLTPQDVAALLSEQRDDIVDSLENALIDSQAELEQQLGELKKKLRQLDKTILEVEETRGEVAQEEIKSLIDTELTQLTDQRAELEGLIKRFERERDRLAAEVDSLEDAPSPPDSVSSDSDAVDGTDVIPAPVVRLYEEDFLARLELTVRDADEITLPDGEPLRLDDGYWDHPSRTERGSFQGTMLDALPDDADYRQYPERPWARFSAVESTGLLGQSQQTRLVIDGCTVTRLQTYAEHGSDWAPATLSELHGIVGEALDRSYVRGQDDARHLMIVGSPTGWRQRVIDDIEAGSLLETEVSVCLVDLRTGDAHYYTLLHSRN